MAGWAGGGNPAVQPPASRRRVFIFDGNRVVLVVWDIGTFFVVDRALSSNIRDAERPLILEDLALPPRKRGHPSSEEAKPITLHGKGFASVVLERDTVLPRQLFSVPRGYKNGGTVRTLQQLVTAMCLGWPQTVSPSGSVFPLAPMPELEEAVKEQRDDPRAHYMLGMGYWARGEINSAVREFRVSAKLDRSSPDPHNALSALYEDRGELVRAVSALEASVKLDARDALAWENLGRLYRRIGKEERAVAALRRARALRGGGSNGNRRNPPAPR